MTLVAAVPGLDPVAYQRSPLHSDDRLWPEKNCYADIWIEVLHALRLEPRAMLPFVFDIEFEGDQWTFFKPVHSELLELYGLDVQELTVWRPLLEHVLEHLPAGRLISTEADAFWLPDTAGTDYRRKHVKTTIVINAIDVDSKQVDYFHNASYYRATGEDFDQLFRIGAAPDPDFLPLFAEFVRTGRIRRQDPAALGAASRRLLRQHVERRLAHNPVEAFATRFECELPLLQERGLDFYHLWAFASLRQLGAAMELGASNLAWLRELGLLQSGEAEAALLEISATCKSLVLKGARAVNGRRALDVRTPCTTMAAAWDSALTQLRQQLIG